MSTTTTSQSAPCTDQKDGFKQEVVSLVGTVATAVLCAIGVLVVEIWTIVTQTHDPYARVFAAILCLIGDLIYWSNITKNVVRRTSSIFSYLP